MHLSGGGGGIFSNMELNSHHHRFEDFEDDPEVKFNPEDADMVKVYDYYLNENASYENSVNPAKTTVIKSEFPSNLTATTPDEDIWKKFQLLPTPPRSPSRDSSNNLELLDDITDYFSNAGDCLEYFTEYLDSDVSTVNSNGVSGSPTGTSTLATALSPWPSKLKVKWDLLHDCMWSGRCADSCKQKDNTVEKALPWTDLSPSLTDWCGLFEQPADGFSCTGNVLDASGEADSPVAPLVSPLLPVVPEVERDVKPLLKLLEDEDSSGDVVQAGLTPYTPLSDHCYHQIISSPVSVRPVSTVREDGAALRNSSSVCGANNNHLHNSSSVKIELNIGDFLGANRRNIILSDTPSDSDDEIDVVTVPKSISLKTVKPIKISLPTSYNNNSDKPYVTQSQKVKAKLGRRPKCVIENHHTPTSTRFERERKIKREEPQPSSTRQYNNGAAITIKRERLDDHLTTVSCGSWSSDSAVFATPQDFSSFASPAKRRNIGNSQQQQHHNNKQKEPKKYRRFKKSRKYSSNGSSRSSSDSEDCEKRSQHNSMERKRRDDLRFAFQNLRENVPDLKDNPKAPKVMILNKAANYAKQLANTGAALEKTLKQENKRRLELQRKLQQLQRLN